MEPELLLKRLDDIAHALERSEHALMLIGLGSVGLELDRLDAYSDLDFFAIVEPGYKAAYLQDLGWLSAASPIAYYFANTRDGYKLLFTDQIFCEFAVFEPQELDTIPFAPGRIVWKRPAVPAELAQPKLKTEREAKRDPDWLLGEALTNMFIGLGREKRGERLSAMRFIQGYAVDRVLQLADLVETKTAARGDPFAIERRFEQRYPGVSAHLPAFLQGYERNCASALAILAFLEGHFEVNQELAAAIRGLCASSIRP